MVICGFQPVYLCGKHEAIVDYKYLPKYEQLSPSEHNCTRWSPGCHLSLSVGRGAPRDQSMTNMLKLFPDLARGTLELPFLSINT